MNLQQINQRLEEIIKLLPDKIKLLQEAEYVYDKRHSWLVSHSAMSNAISREAEAKTICEEENLYGPLTEIRGDVKALYVEKDCLIEIARNLRTLQSGKGIHE